MTNRLLHIGSNDCGCWARKLEIESTAARVGVSLQSRGPILRKIRWVKIDREISDGGQSEMCFSACAHDDAQSTELFGIKMWFTQALGVAGLQEVRFARP